MNDYEFSVVVRYRIKATDLAEAERIARATTEGVRSDLNATDVALLHILILETPTAGDRRPDL